jgi:transposase-like protein
MPSKRPQRSYDHRLVGLVQETGDPTLATRFGVPRSTAYGWIRRARREVTTVSGEDRSAAYLLRQNAVLKKQVGRLRAVLRVLFVLFRVLKPDLARLRIPASDKERLMRAVDRTRGVLGLRRVLSLFGLSAARLPASPPRKSP